MRILTKIKQLFCKHSFEKHYIPYGFRIVDGWLVHTTDNFVKIVNHKVHEYGKKVEPETVGQCTGRKDVPMMNYYLKGI